MPRIGQIVVAVLTATVACAGGAAAVSSVTGVSPMVLLRPTSASSMQVLTVANVNSARVPDIAPAVAHASLDPQADDFTATEPNETRTVSPRPSASAHAPASPKPEPSPRASTSALATPSPAVTPGSSTDDDGDDSGKHNSQSDDQGADD
jgi:hypothetical protein